MQSTEVKVLTGQGIILFFMSEFPKNGVKKSLYGRLINLK